MQEHKKNIIGGLNKLFDHRVRLGIMAMLLVSERVDFNQLKAQLGITDGRLAGHLKALEEAKYIEVLKQFIGKRPNTSYHVTGAGREAFKEHLDALEHLLTLRENLPPRSSD